MRSRYLVLGLVLVLAACVSVENFSYVGPHSYPPTPDHQPLDMYYLTLGSTELSQAHGLTRDYEVIASFEVKQMGEHVGNLQSRAREKGREVGGDGVIYQAMPSGDDSSVAMVWVIRYTN